MRTLHSPVAGHPFLKIIPIKCLALLCASLLAGATACLGADSLAPTPTLRPREVGKLLVLQDTEALRKRAEGGDGEAQIILADLYYSGSQGFATNRLEAYKWVFVANSQGYRDAKYVVAELELFVPEKELAEGKQLAKEYLAKLPKGEKARKPND